MEIQWIIVGVIVAAAAAVVLLRIIRALKGKAACSCGKAPDACPLSREQRQACEGSPDRQGEQDARDGEVDQNP